MTHEPLTMNRVYERQSRHVFEVAVVERPQPGAVPERAGSDGEIEFAAVRL